MFKIEKKKDKMNRIYQGRYQLEMKRMNRLCLRLKGKIRIGRKVKQDINGNSLYWAWEVCGYYKQSQKRLLRNRFNK